MQSVPLIKRALWGSAAKIDQRVVVGVSSMKVGWHRDSLLFAERQDATVAALAALARIDVALLLHSPASRYA